jgi:hypothetical protein
MHKWGPPININIWAGKQGLFQSLRFRHLEMPAVEGFWAAICSRPPGLCTKSWLLNFRLLGEQLLLAAVRLEVAQIKSSSTMDGL